MLRAREFRYVSFFIGIDLDAYTRDTCNPWLRNDRGLEKYSRRSGSFKLYYDDENGDGHLLAAELMPGHSDCGRASGEHQSRWVWLADESRNCLSDALQDYYLLSDAESETLYHMADGRNLADMFATGELSPDHYVEGSRGGDVELSDIQLEHADFRKQAVVLFVCYLPCKIPVSRARAADFRAYVGEDFDAGLDVPLCYYGPYRSPE